DTRGHGFEDLLAAYFLQTFGPGARPDEIFQFVGEPPKWASQKAELVSLVKNDDEYSGLTFSTSSQACVCLGYKADTYAGDLRWFENAQKTPFLFPSNHMGPDLVFVLRLPQDQYFWVVV